jgi:ParB-like chromosome segregation protein Spo0J
MSNTIPIKQLDPSTLGHLPTTNPNVMDPWKFEQLTNGIREHGFLQPVLVVFEDDEPIIVDGEHRTRAAMEVGLKKIPCAIARDRKHAEILRLALNRLRGELDLGEVGRQLEALSEMGFDTGELELTGFSEAEIDALTNAVEFADEDDLLEGSTGGDDTLKEKTFNITLKFDSESERAAVREALEEEGRGILEDGIRSLLDVTGVN